MFKFMRARLTFRPLVLFVGLLVASAAVGFAQPELQLGNVTYSRAEAPALRMPVTRSARFFRAVGGVAFNAVAEGQLGLVVHNLRYDATAADGQRLVISMGSPAGPRRTVRASIYDWELVPIARFALDENGSAVTMFGRLKDEDAYRRTLAAGHDVINYHPKLDNTLLGLRLFQADILIIQPSAADLFRQNGRVILGAGEDGHDVAQNRERHRHLFQWQQEQKQRGHDFQSYVVGDIGQRVTFSVRNGAVVFTGTPYWSAWRSKYPDGRARQQELTRRFNELVGPYNAQLNYLKAGKGTAPQLIAALKLEAMRKELDSLEQQIAELDAVTELPEYSQALSARIKELDGINPVVYKAVETVMHYRALFKHYQQRNAAAFGALVDSLSGVAIEPEVKTPTIQAVARD